MNITLNAVFMTHTTRLLLPTLIKNGPSQILNISLGAQEGIPGVPIYSATKAYVSALTKSVNREYKASAIKVDIISIVPGEVTSQTNRPAHRGFGVIDARPYARIVMRRAPSAAARGGMIFRLTPVVQNCNGSIATEDSDGKYYLFPFGKMSMVGRRSPQGNSTDADLLLYFEKSEVDNIISLRDMVEAASLN